MLSLVVPHVLRYSRQITLVASCFFALALATYFGSVQVNGIRHVSLSDFEIGKVADRDVVAARELAYVDENATRLRREARQRLVTAVFRYDRSLSSSMTESFSSFTDYLDQLFRTSSGLEQFILELQQEYPGVLERKHMQGLYMNPDRSGFLSISRQIFKQLVNEGIAAFPDEGMERFNQTDVEVVRYKQDRQERAEVPKDSLLTPSDVKSRVLSSLTIMKKGPGLLDQLMAVMRPFLKENLVYQSDESEAKLESAVRQVAPVMVVIEKGQKIVKRGFLVTEESYQQLEALASSGSGVNAREFAGAALFLAMLALLSCYALSIALRDDSLDFGLQCFLAISLSSLYVLTMIVSRIGFLALPLDMAVVLPSSLISMICAVLINRRIALVMTFLGALFVMLASDFSPIMSTYALVSGVAGVSAVKMTGKRIDLIKSASLMAIVQPLIALVLDIVRPESSSSLTFTLMGTGVNGFMSGILLLGFLPILESLLNTSTSFRLMEFSDLNSPIMKKMLLSVSGTYNHSIMVATLAESACREIGADPLLARVGAYYHDIGKIDQSEYFVENQTSYNKHLDLNPRLSATVIRSHVKQGIEKARQLRLPDEVIDIISEHHGNSLIAYFYNEACKRDEIVDKEDFTYPGTPPRTKESAVVMLADVVEAACRTLEKPTVSRLEKFINELVAGKIEHRQLDNSDLTLRDIDAIKRTFVGILAGYYHSRIEYPNQKDPDSREQARMDVSRQESTAKGKKHDQ